MDSISRLFTRTKNFYIYLMYDIADPRTNDWFLITTPTIFPIIFTYAYIVLKAGPREGFYYGWFNGYSFKCQPVDYSNNPKALRAAHACYWYYMAKVFELMDTMFFVLRKKNNQVSLLHVYHHSVMPLISWGGTKYYPGGHGTFIGFVNSFTHIIMYSYYMLAAMGPRFKQYLWWKKYITTLQLIQFCMIFIHGSLLWVYECNFPKWICWMVMPNLIFFYYLFSDFYKRSYVRKMKQLEGKQTSNNGIVTGETTLIKRFTNGLLFRKRK